MQADQAGAPAAVQVGREWRRIVRLRDRWRVDDRWWTEEPVSRMYFEVELEEGRALHLFHDQIADAWYEQRVG